MCARRPNIQNRKKGVPGGHPAPMKRPICGYYTSALSGCQKEAYGLETALERLIGALLFTGCTVNECGISCKTQGTPVSIMQIKSR
jgi:hypothetical protein